MPEINNIWMVAREYGELAGAGGVKDVVRQLALALGRSGRALRVVLPAYGFISLEKAGFADIGLEFDLDMDYPQESRRERVRVWCLRGAVDVYLLDSPRFREKLGVYTYTKDEEDRAAGKHYGAGHYDYFAMNVLLQKGALALMIHLGERPDVIHCHDGHTALIPAMTREIEGWRHYFAKSSCLVTIHNAGIGYHQEVADLSFAQAITSLPKRVIAANLLNGAFDPFLAASAYGPLNTVSENYARELQESWADEATGWLGHELKARGVTIAGVTNGIDPDDFDPQRPEKLGLAAPFSPLEPSQKFLQGKRRCRRALLEEITTGRRRGIRRDGSLSLDFSGPLFTFVGRLTGQKGVDILSVSLKKILPKEGNFQILILGSGEEAIEGDLVRLARSKRWAGRISLLRGYDPLLANKVYAAGDFFLIPSRYEPCGLTDFMAQLMGNLPIVHAVGGLVKVVDGETGFTYRGAEPKQLMAAMVRALRLYEEEPERLYVMRKAAVELIKRRYTWDRVKEAYLALYGSEDR